MYYLGSALGATLATFRHLWRPYPVYSNDLAFLRGFVSLWHAFR
jgi:hypothetical protein